MPQDMIEAAAHARRAYTRRAAERRAADPAQLAKAIRTVAVADDDQLRAIANADDEHVARVVAALVTSTRGMSDDELAPLRRLIAPLPGTTG